MAEDRGVLHANLSGTAHRGWQDFCEDQGVSIAGLLEAIGQDLAQSVETGASDELVQSERIRRARQIDADRRRRGPRTVS
jgi:hypothetical protein